MPINRPVRAVTRDGKVINGRRLNEDTYGLQLVDDRERLHSLVKADLREYTIGKTSPMPSFKGTLSNGEIAFNTKPPMRKSRLLGALPA